MELNIFLSKEMTVAINCDNVISRRQNGIFNIWIRDYFPYFI